MRRIIENFRIDDRAMRYSQFVPRLYNYCLSLGFVRESMMPSRAFCSDESQGYPVILIAQHFGTFPFDHGRSAARSRPTGTPPMPITAKTSSSSRRVTLVTTPTQSGSASTSVSGRAARSSGTIAASSAPCCIGTNRNIVTPASTSGAARLTASPAVFVDNQLLDENRPEGLLLNLDRLIDRGQDRNQDPLKVLSTSKAFPAASDLVERLPSDIWRNKPDLIGSHLTAELFFFRRTVAQGPEGHDMLETALGPAMPALVTSPHPALDAARYHTQVEFDRTYRSIRREVAYRDKNLLFISGLNIDISPGRELKFPLTKFVPWAAYVRFRDGRNLHLEQDELTEMLRRQSTDNPDRMSFDASIHDMSEVDAVTIET
jgi:hypothetical protein